MTVYIDDYNAKYGRMIMCHMTSDDQDNDFDELHKMAQKIGVRWKWYQDHSLPHYDICLSKKKKAIDNGAIEVTSKDLVGIMKTIIHKRRQERREKRS